MKPQCHDPVEAILYLLLQQWLDDPDNDAMTEEQIVSIMGRPVGRYLFIAVLCEYVVDMEGFRITSTGIHYLASEKRTAEQVAPD